MQRLLILSGGGAKGQYQYGVLSRIGHSQFDIIAGTSVGSLNGLALAMGRYSELERIWPVIRNKDVYNGKMNAWNAIKALIFKRDHIVDYTPLVDLLAVYYGQVLEKRFICNAVNLETGKHILYDFPVGTLVDEKVLDAVLASSAMPVIFAPVNKEVDGGIVSNNLIGDVLDRVGRNEIEDITIINCNRTHLMKKKGKYNRLLPVAGRTLDILLNNVLVDDIRMFKTINDLILSSDLPNIGEKKYRYIPLTTYELTDKHDVTPWDFDNCHKLFKIGVRDARR